jgi:L-threonylcarbamoyladenylate synthase
MILQPSPENIARAVAALKEGDCVGLPTETVYGLAADGLNPRAVARIFEVKNRPFFDPLILHVAKGYPIEKMVREIPAVAGELMRLYWPGPLTLLLPRQPVIPDLVTAGGETVALRCPKHPVAQHLLEAFGGPLAAPSANPFGRLSPTSAIAVDEELGDKIALTLDGGACGMGLESTIVDCSGSVLKVLRLGALAVEELESVVGKVEVLTKHSVVAPGLLDHHYAPRTPLYLCQSLSMGPLAEGTAALAFQGNEQTHVMSAKGDLAEAATTLFAKLRVLDRSGAEFIIAERVPDYGLGRAINDRLRKASSGMAEWTGQGWKLLPRS